jgi:hypothetical protein
MRLDYILIKHHLDYNPKQLGQNFRWLAPSVHFFVARQLKPSEQ